MKRQESTELPRFAVGALAIAGASAANAATVQISFANNMVSMSSGLTNFVPDVTGDGVNDGLGGIVSVYSVAVCTLQNGRNLAMATHSQFNNAMVLAVNNGLWGPGPARGLVEFSFSDARINGSGRTSGFLDIEAFGFNDYVGNATVKIHRLIFDNESTTAPTGVSTSSTNITEWSAAPAPGGGTSAVPEASTSLGLLALGAGGILTRRRQKRAA